MTDARYIALPLISLYHCLDPINHDISRVYCMSVAVNCRYKLIWKFHTTCVDPSQLMDSLVECVCKDVCVHLPLDKMAAILADDNFKCIFMNENDRIQIRISLKFVPRSPIDNKPTLVQVMAWHCRDNKPLPELMLTQFTDAYMRH